MCSLTKPKRDVHFRGLEEQLPRLQLLGLPRLYSFVSTGLEMLSEYLPGTAHAESDIGILILNLDKVGVRALYATFVSLSARM